MAATATELTLTLVASDITRPLIAGAVQARGITLRAQAAESIDNLSRRMTNAEYDVGEMSFATYIMARREFAHGGAALHRHLHARADHRPVGRGF